MLFKYDQVCSNQFKFIPPGQAYISVNLKPDEIKSQFLEWWDASGRAFIGDRFGNDKVLEQLEEDVYWDDDTLDEERLESEELDASLLHAVLPDAPVPATPAELLTSIEDRSNMVRSLGEVLPQDGGFGMPREEKPLEVECQPQQAKHVEQAKQAKDCDKPAQLGSFSAIREQIQSVKCFATGTEDFAGSQACLDRMLALHKPLKDFNTKVRIAEGLLPPAQIQRLKLISVSDRDVGLD